MKKWFSIIALLLLLSLFISSCANQKLLQPKIKEGIFPFCVEYIYNGETYKYEDEIVCNYVGLKPNQGLGTPDKIRDWGSNLKSTQEEYRDILIVKQYNVKSLFTKDRMNSCSFVYLSFGRADYYMGESILNVNDTPCLYYHESFENSSGTQSGENTVLTEEQLEEYFGIKVIRFDFSSPIENEYE